MIKESAASNDLICVTFQLPATVLAERVSLLGEFNHWDTPATPMSQGRPSSGWQVRLELRTGRRYRFRYLVDGKEWLNDWHADGRL